MQNLKWATAHLSRRLGAGCARRAGRNRGALACRRRRHGLAGAGRHGRRRWAQRARRVCSRHALHGGDAQRARGARSRHARHCRDAQGRAGRAADVRGPMRGTRGAGARGLGVPVRRLGVLAGSVGPVRVFGAPGSILTQFLTQF